MPSWKEIRIGQGKRSSSRVPGPPWMCVTWRGRPKLQTSPRKMVRR